jgi:hypothetical protein
MQDTESTRVKVASLQTVPFVYICSKSQFLNVLVESKTLLL